MNEPTPFERRQAERRKPTVILDANEAWRLIKAAGYTGCFIGHAHEGVIQRIEIPNPKGWGI